MQRGIQFFIALGQPAETALSLQRTRPLRMQRQAPQQQEQGQDDMTDFLHRIQR